MAKANPQVMEMVERQLKKNPTISNPELLEKAKKIDPDVAKLSARQFNARYPLQAKRAMKPRKRTAKKAKKTSESGGAPPSREPSRDGVRKVLFKLAKDVGNAEGKGDVVDVVAGIDRYVEEVLGALAR